MLLVFNKMKTQRTWLINVLGAVLTIALLLGSLLTNAQVSDTSKPKTSEEINVEFATNVGTNNSLSISVEKTFTYNKWKFGPRVEFASLLNIQPYTAEKMDYEMIAQLRVRLLQLEYQLTDRIRIGIAPIWMKRPLPHYGFYQTPSSVYTHIQLKEGFCLEATLTNADRELFELSFRKVI